MKKFEYMIHEVELGQPFTNSETSPMITKLGLEGWMLIMKHQYSIPPDVTISLPVLPKSIVQFIFIREIPPEMFPS